MRRKRRIFLKAFIGILILTPAPVAWVLFFPIPAGWIVNHALSRVLSGLPYEAHVESAVFRFRFGQPESELAIDRLDVETKQKKQAQNTSSATSAHIRITIPKRGAWHLPPRIPSDVSIATLSLAIDTRTPLPSPPPPPPGKALETSRWALENIPAFRTRFAIRSLSAKLDSPQGNSTWKFLPIDTTLELAPSRKLTAALDLVLAQTRDLPSALADASLDGSSLSLRVTGWLDERPRFRLKTGILRTPSFALDATDASSELTPRVNFEIPVRLSIADPAAFSRSLVPHLPEKILSPLRRYTPDPIAGLQLHSAQFKLTAAARENRSPAALSFSDPAHWKIASRLTAEASIQNIPVHLGADIEKESLVIEIQLPAFNPSGLNLSTQGLPPVFERFPLAAFDLPSSLYARAEANLSPTFLPMFHTVCLKIEGSEFGRIAPTPGYGIEIPGAQIFLNATANLKDNALSSLSLRHVFFVDKKPFVHVGNLNIAFENSVPTHATGTIDMEGLEVPKDWRFWPKDMFPKLREVVTARIQSGRFSAHDVEFDAPLNLKDIKLIRPKKLKARFGISNLAVMPASVASGKDIPPKIENLSFDLDWPSVKIFTHVSSKSDNFFSNLEIAGLDQESPRLESNGSGEADISAIPHWINAWLITFDQPPLKLPPPALNNLSGRFQAKWDLTTPIPSLATLAHPSRLALPDLASIAGKLNIRAWPKLDLPSFAINSGECEFNITTDESAVILALDTAGLGISVPKPLGIFGTLGSNIQLSAQHGAPHNAPSPPPPPLVNLTATLDTSRLYSSSIRRKKEHAAPGSFQIIGEPRASVQLNATLSHLNLTRHPSQFTLELTSAHALPLPLALRVNGEIPGSLDKLPQTILAKLNLGDTALDATFEASRPASETATSSPTKLSCYSSRMDIPQLAKFFHAYDLKKTAAGKTSATNSIQFSKTNPPPPFFPLVFKAGIGDLQLAPGHHINGLELIATLPDTSLVPRELHLSAAAAPHHPIRLDLAASSSPSRTESSPVSVTLSIADTCSFLRTLTTAASQLPTDALSPATTRNIAALAEIPAHFSGGHLMLSGEITPPAAPASGSNPPLPSFDGTLALAQIKMLSPPRLLQLLSLKTRKSLQHTPLLEQATVRRIHFRPPELAIEQLDFAGAGLLNLKLASATHNLVTDALKIDGTYYGIGFEVTGSRASPDVYLKENVVTKILGKESDLHWGD